MMKQTNTTTKPLNNKNNENQNKMWVRTISGWVFFDVTYTIQGMPIIISSKKQLNNKTNEQFHHRFF
jgi:hypothetical protein